MGTNVLLPENAIPLIRGTSKTLKLTVVDLDNKPIDLTGATVHFTVKLEPFDRNPVIKKSSQNIAEAEISSPPQDGIARIFLDPADTQDLECRLYVFDVWVILQSGKRYCVVKQSTLELLPGITVLPLP